jgi:competence protein ComEC
VACSPTDPKIRVLWGQVKSDEGWDPEDFSNENNHSVVTRIDYGDASILITGDLEEARRQGFSAGIERLHQEYAGTGLLDADVYQVGHHGSWNGTTKDLVSAISPEMAVISAGPPCKRDRFSAWSHGHPRKATIADLEEGVTGTRPTKSVKVFPAADTEPVKINESKAIYSTSWDGTIVLEAKPDGTWKVKSLGTPQNCSS